MEINHLIFWAKTKNMIIKKIRTKLFGQYEQQVCAVANACAQRLNTDFHIAKSYRAVCSRSQSAWNRYNCKLEYLELRRIFFSLDTRQCTTDHRPIELPSEMRCCVLSALTLVSLTTPQKSPLKRAHKIGFLFLNENACSCGCFTAAIHNLLSAANLTRNQVAVNSIHFVVVMTLFLFITDEADVPFQTVSAMSIDFMLIFTEKKPKMS